MSARLRVAVIGHGYFGAFHAKHYAAMPDVEFVAIADPRATITSAGAPHVKDHRALLGRVDAVSIAAPTALHHAIAGEFLDAGVHALVEKPLADTAERAGDLAARAERAGVVLRVGHIERFSPAYRALRAAVSRPLMIEARRHTLWTGRAIDVDVVFDLMIHDIDLVLDLVGTMPASVEAHGVALMGRDLDAVDARLTFADGTAASLSASRIALVAGRTLTSYEAGRVLTADLAARALSVFDAATARRSAVEVTPGDALGHELKAFLDAVRGEASPGAGGADATRALLVAEQIRGAAERLTSG